MPNGLNGVISLKGDPTKINMLIYYTELLNFKFTPSFSRGYQHVCGARIWNHQNILHSFHLVCEKH